MRGADCGILNCGRDRGKSGEVDERYYGNDGICHPSADGAFVKKRILPRRKLGFGSNENAGFESRPFSKTSEIVYG
jgi:hypothetical protein